MADKDSIPCIPDGVWEATKPDDKKNKKSDITTDLQGNGYPIPLKNTTKDL